MLNTPFDVVKTRIQNQPKGSVLKYNWTLPGVAIVYREEGYVNTHSTNQLSWEISPLELLTLLLYHPTLVSVRCTKALCQRF